MFAIAVAMFALCGLLGASRRFLTRASSRVAASLAQGLLVVCGVGALVAEHQHLGSLPRAIVTVSVAFVGCVLLDAAGVTRLLARSLGG